MYNRQQSLSFMSLLAHFIHSVKNENPALHNNQSSISDMKNPLSPRKPIVSSVSIDQTNKTHVIKVCSLFKPLLRRFRSFFRTKFDQGRKISLYQHWKPEGYINHTRKFMKSMQFPETLMDEVSTLKMLTIIFPCTIKKVKPNHFKSERNLLIQIFRENCNSKRSKFFMDPLIKFLWNNVFMVEASDIVHKHLRAIRSDPSYGEDPTRKLV